MTARPEDPAPNPHATEAEVQAAAEGEAEYEAADNTDAAEESER